MLLVSGMLYPILSHKITLRRRSLSSEEDTFLAVLSLFEFGTTIQDTAGLLCFQMIDLSQLEAHHCSWNLLESCLRMLSFIIFYFLAAPSGMWDLKFPNQRLNPLPLQWKCKVLTPGPPGKYPMNAFLLPTILQQEWDTLSGGVCQQSMFQVQRSPILDVSKAFFQSSHSLFLPTGREGRQGSDPSYCISVTSYPYISLWAPLLLLITATSKLGIGGLEHSPMTSSFYNRLLLFEKHLPLSFQSCLPSPVQEFLISSPPRISHLIFLLYCGFVILNMSSPFCHFQKSVLSLPS